MPARILLVEDNAANLKLMAYLLRASGHTLTTATDGAQGLEMIRTHDYDLIVCDIQIPKLDGCSLAGILKAHSRFQAIPLVAVTALAMVGDEDKILAAGFDGYLAKPIAPQTFVAQLQEFLPSDKQGPLPAALQQPTKRPSGIVRPAAIGMVLVVDNSPVNIGLIRSILEPAGYRIEAAGTGPEGLLLARLTSPSLILCDLHMPGMSGFDFIRAVKADPQLQAIPFVFITASSCEEKDRADGLALGADKFLIRPMEPETLVAEIEACLRSPTRLPPP